MEWYHHVILYPQAFIAVLPLYVWKTILGLKEFCIAVHREKQSYEDPHPHTEERTDDAPDLPAADPPAGGVRRRRHRDLREDQQLT